MGKSWVVTKINQNYILRTGMKKIQCQVGEYGFKIFTKKKEGDKTTPIGKWKLKSIYYRSDKLLRPIVKDKKFKIQKITKNCCWCDDPKSKLYNKYFNLKKSFSIKNISYERLWREDQVYDLVIETSYNTKPIIKGKGSAIFLHCSFSDYRDTGGCVALNMRDLTFLIKNISNQVNLEIKNKF